MKFFHENFVGKLVYSQVSMFPMVINFVFIVSILLINRKNAITTTEHIIVALDKFIGDI